MAEIDIVVVDNGSADGTLKLVQDGFPSVRVVVPAGNVGFGRACNLAVRRTGAPFVLLLNPDAVACADAIRHLFRFMESHPGAGVAGAKLVDPSGRPLQSMGDRPGLSGLLLDKLLALFSRHARSDGWLRRLLAGLSSKYRLPSRAERVAWVSGAAMCVRREAWEQVGGFDENIFLYYDDVDLCLRIAEAEWEVWHVPEAVVVHHSGASFGGDQDWQKREHYLSQGYFFRKHNGEISAALVGVFRGVYAKLRLYRYFARDRIGRPLKPDR